MKKKQNKTSNDTSKKIPEKPEVIPGMFLTWELCPCCIMRMTVEEVEEIGICAKCLYNLNLDWDD